jgi:hypothetical protein
MIWSQYWKSETEYTLYNNAHCLDLSRQLKTIRASSALNTICLFANALQQRTRIRCWFAQPGFVPKHSWHDARTVPRELSAILAVYPCRSSLPPSSRRTVKHRSSAARVCVALNTLYLLTCTFLPPVPTRLTLFNQLQGWLQAVTGVSLTCNLSVLRPVPLSLFVAY